MYWLTYYPINQVSTLNLQWQDSTIHPDNTVILSIPTLWGKNDNHEAINMCFREYLGNTMAVNVLARFVADHGSHDIDNVI